MRAETRGFTLVEVMVAVVVLGLAAVALANAFGSSARGFARMEERTAAWLLASDKLVEMQVYQQWPEVGVQDERRQVEDQQWLIRTRISAGPYPDTRRVDIEVGPEPGFGADFYVVFGHASLLGKPFDASGNAADNPDPGAGGGGGES